MGSPWRSYDVFLSRLAKQRKGRPGAFSTAAGRGAARGRTSRSEAARHVTLRPKRMEAGEVFCVVRGALSVAGKLALIVAMASLGLGCSRDMIRVQQMYEDYRKDFPAVEGISAPELRERAGNEPVILVDVRTPEEQRVSKIPGAVTSQEFEADRERYRDAAIVAYCTIGARSGRYAAGLMEDGFQVRNLEGGVLAWTYAGGDLVGPDGPTRKVHVYGRRWNMVADGYEAVW